MGTDGIIEVYHGGTEIIKNPLVCTGRAGLDFGQGFYVTAIRQQAELWADRMARQRRAQKFISIYSLDMSAVRRNYVYLFFPEYDIDWLNFIAQSRTGNKPWLGYDCIEGGIANDRVIDMVEAYIAGTLTPEYALSELGKHQPNHQICILNQKVIDDCLQFKEGLPC
ncbi:MAG: DUF3990 domain-containing protein [Paludibacteraceae bacterium]|nr:DUF3990 domain-containing protein [Paludibacteraceae bacterium]